MSLDIAEKSPKSSFLILSDSLSCLKALQKPDVTCPIIAKIQLKIHSLILKKKKIVLAWLPSHVGLQGNEQVDLLAKEALDLPTPPDCKVPHTDFKPGIKDLIFSSWEDQWSSQAGNKLFEVKPRLRPRIHWDLPRRDEVVFNRLKIGHSVFTHRHIFDGDDKPFCDSCHCLFTVKHLLLECVEFQHIRTKHFKCTCLKVLFDVVPPHKILNFIKEVGFYNKL